MWHPYFPDPTPVPPAVEGNSNFETLKYAMAVDFDGAFGSLRKGDERQQKCAAAAFSSVSMQVTACRRNCSIDDPLKVLNFLLNITTILSVAFSIVKHALVLINRHRNEVTLFQYPP